MSVPAPNNVAGVAQQIADEGSITNRKLPASLLQLKKLIDSVPPYSEELDSIVHDIWQLKLIDVLAVVLKMDFTAVPPDGWATAGQLVDLASQCFTCDQARSVEYLRDMKAAEMLLQMVVEAIFECARNCAHRYAGLVGETQTPANGTEKIYCQRALKEMLQNVLVLVENYPALGGQVVRSANMAQILMSEIEDVAIIAIAFLGSLHALQPEVIPRDYDGQDVVEELLFKLATTSSSLLAKECISSLSKIIDFNPRYANLINAKFKGVKEMITENWNSHLMLRENDLKDFYHLIDARDPSKATKRAMNPQLRATMIIQAYVRSFLARKRLRLANTAFTKLQQKWRARKKRELEERMQRESEENAKFQLFLAKKHRVRKSRQTLLKQMLATPAEQFPGFLRNLEQSAAARIQAAWKGHQVRRRYNKDSEAEKKDRAAKQIQQSYRRYRARSKADSSASSLLTRNKAYEIPELTPERRGELEREIQRRIIDFKAKNPSVLWNRERLSVLHKKGQEALAEYYRKILDNRRFMYESRTAMARIDIDLSTMRETCPRLEVSSLQDAARLACPSKPIKARAALEHRQTMELLTGPWWARFGLETEREEEEYRRLIADNPHAFHMPQNLLLVPEKDNPASQELE